MVSPASTLEEAYRNLDLLPLESGDERWVDCSAVRGGPGTSVETLARRIKASPLPVHQLLAGHRGCGKSTELKRLAAHLKEQGYLVIYFASDDDIDLGDVQYSDILIAIFKRLEKAAREEGLSIDERLEKDILKWLADKVYSWTDVTETEKVLSGEFSIGPLAPLPFLAKILARISGQIKTGHAIKEDVRLKLDPQISQFIERVNLFIDAAYTGLRKKGYKDLVMIIDNLDRTVFKVLDAAANRTSHDAIYLERADQLKALKVNVVYTVPISMFYSLKATQLTGAFPWHLILPMIKVNDRDGSPFEDGRNVLLEVAHKRLAAGKIITEDGLKYLAEKSGGMMRDFIRLLSYAMEIGLALNQEAPLDVAVTRAAFQRLVNEYGRMIPPEHFPLLYQVHREKRARNDAAHQAMLFNLSVLEYLNLERWCDVHPAVLELREFKEAVPDRLAPK